VQTDMKKDAEKRTSNFSHTPKTQPTPAAKKMFKNGKIDPEKDQQLLGLSKDHQELLERIDNDEKQMEHQRYLIGKVLDRYRSSKSSLSVANKNLVNYQISKWVKKKNTKPSLERNQSSPLTIKT